MSDWEIHGTELTNCNCAWGCPCQFNAMPTSNQCEAIWAMHIAKGNFGATNLDGLSWGFLVWWPGAVHEGNGRMQVFGDESATAEQRKALETIAYGTASAEGTYFQIFAAMAPNREPAIWKPVKYECDVASGTAMLTVADLIDTSLEPIRNPMTGNVHRARVTLPEGFEYREAEYVSGTTRSKAAIKLNLSSSHAHVANVGWDASRCLPG